MFSKSKANVASDRAAPRASTPPSLISAGLTIIGNLRSEGEIQIDGEVQGDIACARLTVGESGTVKGEITADHVDIRGEVMGRIHGGSVTLAESAKVSGDIFHRSLAMQAGAYLEGQVRRGEAPKEEAAARPRLLQGTANGETRDAPVALDGDKAAANA